MPRWLLPLCLSISPIAWACNDELVDDVPQTVCYSGKQWIGGKRGSPNMYPGRDCVGCHLENDGPELMFGGTVYEYVEGNPTVLNELQTGEDCFGVAGATITIEGGDGQVFEIVTNEAGNFYLEGKATDLVKPFTARVNWTSKRPDRETPPQSAMFETPEYGGCARCHTPGGTAYPPMGDPPPGYSEDQRVRVVARIGLTGEVNLAEALGDQ